MGKGLFGNSFKGIDAFGKTLEDVKVKTRTGALLTMASIATIMVLLTYEFFDYRRIYIDTSVIVDKSRGQRVTVNLNMTFPKVPCFLLSLDVMDISGEHLRDISHHIIKNRIDSHLRPVPNLPDVFNSDLGSDLDKAGQIRAPGYCGSCYGGMEPANGCCQTCEDVRQAYVSRGWSFGNPEAVEQCQSEGWIEKLQAQVDEGCNVSGRIRINKVVSNLQITPGRSYQSNAPNIHTLVPYLKDDNSIHFGHIIHRFQFEADDEYNESRAKRAKGLKEKVGVKKGTLEGIVGGAYRNPGKIMYHYFVKVVSTQFDTIDNQRIFSHQYSANSFQRQLSQADHGQNPDGTTFTHGSEAQLGVFFNFEISPMRVIHTEKRHAFAHFLTSACAIIGGVLTVGSLLDSLVFTSLKMEDGQ